MPETPENDQCQAPGSSSTLIRPHGSISECYLAPDDLKPQVTVWKSGLSLRVTIF